MGAVLPLALQKIQDEYVLFGATGLLCLAVFVGLIFIPAVSSYGRIWEKAVAGLLSVFLLAALVSIGAVLGIAVVLNYDSLLDLVHGR